MKGIYPIRVSSAVSDNIAGLAFRGRSTRRPQEVRESNGAPAMPALPWSTTFLLCGDIAGRNLHELYVTAGAGLETIRILEP